MHLLAKSIEELKIILENIRFELNISRNHYIFFNSLETGANFFEFFASMYLDVNLNGTYADLKQDPNFTLDLLMVASEINVSDYIDPKMSLFLQLFKSYYCKIAKKKLLNNKNSKKKPEEELAVHTQQKENIANENEQQQSQAQFIENIKEKLKFFILNN